MPSIGLDYDYFEVNDGWFFKLLSRTFVQCPFKQNEFGKISPMGYQNFDRGTIADGGCFAKSLENSFPDLKKRVRFCNKLYQCLLCHQQPHKIPKLVTIGETFYLITFDNFCYVQVASNNTFRKY